MRATEGAPECWCGKPCERNGRRYRKECSAHRWRRRNGKERTEYAKPVREKASDSFEGVFRGFLRFRDELDTATDEEYQLERERAREKLRLYLRDYVRRLTKLRHPRLVSREVRDDGLTLITFKELKRSTNPRSTT